MSHPTCHLLSLLSREPGPPLSSSACSPPRAPWPQGCSLPPRPALASAGGFASSGLGRHLRALGPWWGLRAALVAAFAHRRSSSRSREPRRPPSLRPLLPPLLPPRDTAHCPSRAWPGCALHRTAPPTDSTGSGSRAGWARLEATGSVPRGPPGHMLRRRALDAAGGDRASLHGRVCGCHPSGPPSPSSRPERPEVPGRLLPATPTNLTVVYLNGF